MSSRTFCTSMSDSLVYTIRRKSRGYVFTCSDPRLHKLLGRDLFSTGFTVAEDPSTVIAYLQRIYPEAIVLFDDLLQEPIELPPPSETVSLQVLRDLPESVMLILHIYLH